MRGVRANRSRCAVSQAPFNLRFSCLHSNPNSNTQGGDSETRYAQGRSLVTRCPVLLGPAWSLLRGRDLDRLQGVPYWPVGRRLLQPRWRHSSLLAAFGSSIPGAELTSEPSQVFKLCWRPVPLAGSRLFSVAGRQPRGHAAGRRSPREPVSEKTQRQRGRRQEAGSSERGRRPEGDLPRTRWETGARFSGYQPPRECRGMLALPWAP